MEKSKRPAASLLAFMADLHHEIRSPVNTILNMTELASKEELPPSVANYFKTIEKSANSLLVLLDDIIELSQDDIEAAGLEHDFSITDLLEDMKETIEGPLKAKKASITLSMEKEVPEWFSGPRGRVRQVLTQVCNYSIRHMAAKDIKISIDVDNINAPKELRFNIHAKKCNQAIPSPKDILRNPRILICQRLLFELGNELSIHEQDEGVSYFFAIKVNKVDIPWGEPIFPTPWSCIVSRNDLSSSLVERRLKGCGFSVLRAKDPNDAMTTLDSQGPESCKKVALIQWGAGDELTVEEIDLDAKSLRHPVIYFDVPAIRMMDMSARFSEKDEKCSRLGLVMAPSRGKQLLSEVLRVLGMEPEQLSCPFSLEESRPGSCLSPEDLKGMKVLVVEDDRINQRIVVELLKKFEIKPVVASTGKAALNAVKKRRFDAIFMDINLPDTDGYRLTEEIRSMPVNNEIPIIALTASTKNRGMCMDAGMDYFLSKPYSEARLLNSLIATKRK